MFQAVHREKRMVLYVVVFVESITNASVGGNCEEQNNESGRELRQKTSRVDVISSTCQFLTLTVVVGSHGAEKKRFFIYFSLFRSARVLIIHDKNRSFADSSFSVTYVGIPGSLESQSHFHGGQKMCQLNKCESLVHDKEQKVKDNENKVDQ